MRLSYQFYIFALCSQFVSPIFSSFLSELRERFSGNAFAKIQEIWKFPEESHVCCTHVCYVQCDIFDEK